MSSPRVCKSLKMAYLRRSLVFPLFQKTLYDEFFCWGAADAAGLEVEELIFIQFAHGCGVAERGDFFC